MPLRAVATITARDLFNLYRFDQTEQEKSSMHDALVGHSDGEGLGVTAIHATFSIAIVDNIHVHRRCARSTLVHEEGQVAIH